MYDLLLLNATLGDRRVDLAIQSTRIAAIEPAGTLAQASASRRIDASHLALRAPFYNTHTHQAMTLLRGVGSELALMDWLTQAIWPREAKLTPALVKAGTKLAIVEMLHSGCVAFNDMYFHQPSVIEAATELGVRAQIGLVVMDQVSDHIENDATLALRDALPNTIHLAYAPHALYTTTPELLTSIATTSERLGLPIHIHAAESLAEVEQSQTRFGCTPIAYLDRCGLLNDRTILAHCCHMTDEDIERLVRRRCIVAHCPSSNQLLASGVFPYAKAERAGVRITVGTDGAASNNGLSMIAETKAALLSAKLGSGAPEQISLARLDQHVTTEAAMALGFDGAGSLRVGAPADLIGLDLRAPCFAGGGSVESNFILAGDTSVVELVLCNGRVVLEDHRVPNEDAILDEAREATRALNAATLIQN